MAINLKVVLLTINSSVSSVRSTSEAWRVINLNVIDYEPIDVQTLVIGVALGVLQQLQQKLGWLLWPTTCKQQRKIKNKFTLIYWKKKK